jgi:nitroreductase
MDERLQMIYARRSIRQFKGDPLPPELTEELLRAAMAAPSAHNRQPWRFLVITDAAVRQRLSAAHPYAEFAVQSPVVIVVFGEPVGELIDHDLAAATENLLVAAAGLGLGACWCGVTDERRPALHALTGIPAKMRIVSLVCVGYPAEQMEPRSQFDPAKVYYERYPGSA